MYIFIYKYACKYMEILNWHDMINIKKNNLNFVYYKRSEK